WPERRDTRCDASAHRLRALRPCDRAGLRGGGGGSRRGHVRRRRAEPRKVLAPGPRRGGAPDRPSQHVCDRAVARAARGAAQAPRRGRSVSRSRMGELRDHGGRIHRLPRALGCRGRGSRCSCCSPPAKPFPLPRLRDGRLEPEARHAPRVGGPAGCGAVLGRRPGADAARAGLLAPLRRRRARRRPGRLRGTACPAPRGSGMSPASPYRGLAAFDDSELDALYFFGRERDAEIVVANLIASRFTVLYGPSGVGKSSLLLAAVARELRHLPEQPLVSVFYSLVKDPAAALAETVAPGAGIEPGELFEPVERAQAHRDVYLILDQAEEYLTYHDGADGFETSLAAIVNRP